MNIELDDSQNFGKELKCTTDSIVQYWKGVFFTDPTFLTSTSVQTLLKSPLNESVKFRFPKSRNSTDRSGKCEVGSKMNELRTCSCLLTITNINKNPQRSTKKE
jgi:hypothetical protein